MLSNGPPASLFGSSVSMSGDAKTVLVGSSVSFLNDSGGRSTGSAYIFTRSEVSWAETVVLAPIGKRREDNAFISSVKLSNDGKYAFVCAFRQDSEGAEARDAM